MTLILYHILSLILDINECEDISVCNHDCNNTDGSYECSCRDGYELEDDGRCLGNKSTL